jgi:hypothetical protein
MFGYRVYFVERVLCCRLGMGLYGGVRVGIGMFHRASRPCLAITMLMLGVGPHPVCFRGSA